ncbi:putative membrane protein [Acinetobacter sp. 1130196]|jgi:bacterial/archaeal transporter family protein|uniref:Putative membrane protein n=1 Tax=Acinetobacter baumannii (strain 1295743) TaxID=1310613 RepID=A0A009I8W0_ACIB9|nr:putative membrane protein [Acinetobacter baumannii 1295743]EXB12299.1 putative membrane protein [Acinetobacter sp. 1396970]EXG35049.1 putative membrane protein [Acinetobacter baumannii 121738]EXI12655.1 putative membrane protein [Acinetobacter sp. 694762]EXR18971.1 putative membrane protein [Acinetobacter sp. 1130196]
MFRTNICQNYYRALKLGDVSTIALIDKGSAVVAILLAWLILR